MEERRDQETAPELGEAPTAEAAAPAPEGGVVDAGAARAGGDDVAAVAPEPPRPITRAPREGGYIGGRRPRGDRRFPRRKVCAFCESKAQTIDYKDVAHLRRYLSERGRIEPRRKTGTCAKHQRRLSIALKRARHLALLPFTPAHVRHGLARAGAE